MPVMTTRRAIVRLHGEEAISTPDEIAVEAPLTLVLDSVAQDGEMRGEVLATLMRTPGHDLELAAGWLVVESGVRAPDDIAALRECRDGDASDEGADRVHALLRPGVNAPRPRAFLTASSCGVCSADLIDLAPLAWAPGWSSDFGVTRSILAALPETMRSRQRAFQRTGGLHAAALATPSGDLVAVREDVGRHNAVDKVVGQALLSGRLPATDHLLVVSGRVSFEIVQKAVAAAVAGIVAVSAPSSLAVDLARRHGLLLAGLVRPGRLNLYSGAERVRG
jgi:FdhD protein